MTNVKNYFVSVDSLKLSLPLSHVQILNEDILSTKTKQLITDSTGEVVEETKLKGLTQKLIFDHYHIRVAITSRFDFNTQTNIDQLEVYLHSKACEYNYFKGLCSETIGAVYDRLMSANVFYCPLSTFMSGHVNDIDIKKDYNIETEHFKLLTKELEKNARTFKQMGRGVKRYSKSGNIQFNRRETSTSGTPFLKIYDKQDEALNTTDDKSAFFRYYIRKTDIENIKRMECTLKRPDEARTLLGLKNNTLEELLQCKQETLNNALTYCLNKNMNTRIKVKIKQPTTKTITMTDTLIYTTLSLFIHTLEKPFEEAKETMLSQCNSKHMKSRMKKRIEEVYNEQFTGDTKAIKIERVNSLLTQIGWGQKFALYDSAKK